MIITVLVVFVDVISFLAEMYLCTYVHGYHVHTYVILSVQVSDARTFLNTVMLLV